MSKIKSVSQFTKTLNTGLKQLRNGKANVWACAQFAIAHYDGCGDHGPLNAVLTGLRAEGVGASAYVKWVEKYTDQVWAMEEKKLVKDSESERDTIADVALAIVDNFWNMVKSEQEAELFDSEAFFKDIMRVVKKYQNSERKTAESADDIATVTKLSEYVLDKAPQLKAA